MNRSKLLMRMLSLFLAGLLSTALHAQESRTVRLKVSSVISGDTIKGTYKDDAGGYRSEVIRLFGIEAPIKKEDKGFEQPYWKESKEHLENWVNGKSVDARRFKVGNQDFWIISANNKDINLEMVQRGYAWYQPAHVDSDVMRSAHDEAKRSNHGLWSLPQSIAPWNYEQFLRNAPGASRMPADPSAAQTIATLLQATSEVDVVTLWDGLPKNYQDDLESLVQFAAHSLEAETWSSVTSLLEESRQLIRLKGGLLQKSFLTMSLIEGSSTLQAVDARHQATAIKLWDAIAELTQTVATSSLVDQSAMQNFRMDDFLSHDLPTIRNAFFEVRGLARAFRYVPTDAGFRQITDVSVTGDTVTVKFLPPDKIQKKEEVKFEVVDSTPDEATVEVTWNGVTSQQIWMKVDQHWLPASVVKDWNNDLKQAREKIAEWSTPQGQAKQSHVRKILAASFGTTLDHLMATNDPEEFALGLFLMPLAAKVGLSAAWSGDGLEPGDSIFKMDWLDSVEPLNKSTNQQPDF